MSTNFEEVCFRGVGGVASYKRFDYCGNPDYDEEILPLRQSCKYFARSACLGGGLHCPQCSSSVKYLWQSWPRVIKRRRIRCDFDCFFCVILLLIGCETVTVMVEVES